MTPSHFSTFHLPNFALILPFSPKILKFRAFCLLDTEAIADAAPRGRARQIIFTLYYPAPSPPVNRKNILPRAALIIYLL